MTSIRSLLEFPPTGILLVVLMACAASTARADQTTSQVSLSGSANDFTFEYELSGRVSVAGDGVIDYEVSGPFGITIGTDDHFTINGSQNFSTGRRSVTRTPSGSFDVTHEQNEDAFPGVPTVSNLDVNLGVVPINLNQMQFTVGNLGPDSAGIDATLNIDFDPKLAIGFQQTSDAVTIPFPLTIAGDTGHLTMLPGVLQSHLTGAVKGELDFLGYDLGTLTNVDENLDVPIDDSTVAPLVGLPGLVQSETLSDPAPDQTGPAKFGIGAQASEYDADPLIGSLLGGDLLPLELQVDPISFNRTVDNGEPSGIGELEELDVDITIDNMTLSFYDVGYNFEGTAGNAVRGVPEPNGTLLLYLSATWFIGRRQRPHA